MKSPLKEYIQRFPSIRMAVLGDFIADEFIHGATSRISREAPVLVLDFHPTRDRSRGRGQCGDERGGPGRERAGHRRVGSRCGGRKTPPGDGETPRIETGLLLAESERLTPTKTRIMAGGRNTKRQQVIRVDHEKQLDLVGERLESHISLVN